MTMSFSIQHPHAWEITLAKQHCRYDIQTGWTDLQVHVPWDRRYIQTQT